MRLSPASFSALATLLRASLDQAASDREFLQARNCLVTAALFAVDGAEYVSWLREQGGSGSGSADWVPSAVFADSELMSAAAAAATAASAGVANEDGVAPTAAGGTAAVEERSARAGGERTRGADYLLLRELRRHSVWATIELWEVSMSDSVVMALDGGGAQAEPWLTDSVKIALTEVRTYNGGKVLSKRCGGQLYTTLPVEEYGAVGKA